MEALSKVVELIKQLLPMVIGWFVAKQDSKIDVLKEENEKLKEWREIEEVEVKRDDLYKASNW